MQIDDKSILRLLAEERTQKKAFAIIVEQNSEMLYRQIRRMVLDHDDANDVLQNTFLRAWQNITLFQGRSKISSWLYSIAVNEALLFIRSKKTKLPICRDDGGGMSIADTLAADPYFDGDITEAELQEAIARLPLVQRTVFQMRYFDQKKYSEISAILGTSEGALKASYHIAVQKITEFFNDREI